jgi:hypothetical protein
MKKILVKQWLLAGLLLVNFFSQAQIIDLSKAHLIVSDGIKSPQKATYQRVFSEEWLARTQSKLALASDKSSAIILATQSDHKVGNYQIPSLHAIKAEGFKIIHQNVQGKHLLWLIGADERGVLFAIGEFFRTADLSKNRALFDKKFEIETSPQYPLRGHQLGYRNTANSWDAWTVTQYEKYIRELAFFGTNAIENIPFQDGAPGPLMKVPREEMNLKMSEICRDYGLEYWVWTPGDVDLSNPEKFEAELKEHVEFYQKCPQLDGVFFPGGDPGHNHPKDVMPFLKALAAELKKFHPKAGLWVSLQGFSDEQVNYFYDYLHKYQPTWLRGVVSGPSSPDMATTRYRLPKQYLHRHYADLTHTVRCQYPTENWDQAFALTEGREVSNPQPYFYAKVHNRYAPLTDGFLAYSDGVHDDVNKALWSQLAWDSQKDVRQVMVEYARLFYGNSVAELAADGVLALERNWVGPVEENGAIETTFQYWQNLEAKNPGLQANWRWQQMVMRAYYDTYVKRRKLYEQNLEKQANLILLQAKELGAEKAMELALAKVNQADLLRISPELREKIVIYCEALFQSIGMQTSVPKYQASGYERGAILDFIDYPLNNRWWLADEFEKIKKMPNEELKLNRIQVLATWENPGAGSFYDNISDLSKGPRVKTRTDDATDVLWENNGMSRRRLSAQLFQNFPQLEYSDLDPQGHYFIRISGYGDALLRVDGERIEPTSYPKGFEEFKEFPLNPKFVSDGKISVSFDEPEESHLNWRQHSKIFDIWLIKEK